MPKRKDSNEIDDHNRDGVDRLLERGFKTFKVDELLNPKEFVHHLIDHEQFNPKYRPWRFIHENYNNFTKKLISEYKLKYMENVIFIIEKVIKRTSCPIVNPTDNINLIIFIDIENWSKFFSLTESLPPKTYVLGFISATRKWVAPNKGMYQDLKDNKMIHIINNIGPRKNAADFALTVQVGKLHSKLPNHIAFLIISGDLGFLELLNQMKESRRVIALVNPHEKNPNIYDRNASIKMDDGQHLMDIIKVSNYLGLISRFTQNTDNNLMNISDTILSI